MYTIVIINNYVDTFPKLEFPSSPYQTYERYVIEINLSTDKSISIVREATRSNCVRTMFESATGRTSGDVNIHGVSCPRRDALAA